MTYGELTRKLRRLGIEPLRHGSKHDEWFDSRTQRLTRIARHRGEIPSGTLRSILRDLGLTLEDIQNA